MKNNVKQILFILSVVATFAGVFYLGAVGKTSEMGVMAVLGIAIILLLSGSVKSLKFKPSGVEAEMQKVVDEAFATIDYLKKIIVLFSEIMVTNVAARNRWSGSLLHRIKEKNEIIENLKKMDVDKNEIEKISLDFHRWSILDHVSKIRNEAYRINHEQNLQISPFIIDKIFTFDGDIKAYFADVSKIKKHLLEHNLFDDEVDDLLEDLKYFIEKKKVRREEIWED